MIPGIIAQAGANSGGGGGPDEYTKALLYFQGADGSTTFNDETGRIWTPNGAAVISDDQAKYGSTSGFFGSTNDGSNYIEAADAVELRPGTGDYTVEYWWYAIDNPGEWDTVFQKGIWNSSGGLTIICSSGNIKVCADGSDSGNIGHGLSFNAWNHVALARQGTTAKVFVGGVQKGSFTQSANINGTSPVHLMKGGGIVGPAAGYLGMFRYSVGIARYTSDFTPPNAPF